MPPCFYTSCSFYWEAVYTLLSSWWTPRHPIKLNSESLSPWSFPEHPIQPHRVPCSCFCAGASLAYISTALSTTLPYSLLAVYLPLLPDHQLLKKKVQAFPLCGKPLASSRFLINIQNIYSSPQSLQSVNTPALGSFVGDPGRYKSCVISGKSVALSGPLVLHWSSVPLLCP